MFINVNVCFLVTIETHMLATDLKSTALKIGCAKQEFHGPMNSWKRGLGIKSWQLFFPLTEIPFGEIKRLGHGQEKY